MTTAELQQQLTILQSGIKIDAPLVARFFDVQTPLGEYTDALNQHTAHPAHRERQKVLKEKVLQILARQFSAKELADANINTETDWKINIVDHHGFLNHPILVSTNIIANLNAMPTEKPEAVIVLSDSGVPMNNFFHKRGLKFRDTQLNIIPSRDRHVMAVAAGVRQPIELVKAARTAGLTKAADLDFLESIQETLNDVALDPRVKNFRDQVTRSNAVLWKLLWEESLRDQMPELLYVANEDLATALLADYLQDSDNLFHRILFDPETRAVVLREFNTVTGCWDIPGTRGTAFFWGVDETGSAVRMVLSSDGNALVSDSDKSNIRIALTLKSITAALQTGHIYPSMFLVYGIANFYCGVRPLVGYGSMNYQTAMKASWLRTLADIAPEEVALVETVPTDGFIGGPKVTFGWSADHGYYDLFALDSIANGGLSRSYLEALKQMPFADILRPALPDIYDSYVRPERKQPITVTGADFMGESFDWLKTMKQQD